MFRAIQCKRKKTALTAVLCLTTVAAVCVFVLCTGSPDTITVRGESVSLRAADEADIRSFLAACGYENPELQFTAGITIPKHWNETYTLYNALQVRQGFDLVPYKGKAAQEHVYFVSDGRNITVLTSGGRIIAAHICSCDGSECAVLAES